MSIAASFVNNAESNPGKTAVFTPQRTVTYGELHEKTNRAAKALRQTPVKEQKDTPPKAAVLLSNSIEFVEVFLGAAKAGWLAVTFDPKWSDKELAAIIKETKPEILFIEKQFTHIKDEIPASIQVIVCRGEEAPFTTYEQWLKNSNTNDIVLPEVTGGTLFYMGFTSGTTGLPKGFMRTHRSWTESFQEGDKELKLQASDHILVPGPLVHSLFLFAALHALHRGAVCFLEESFQAEAVIERINAGHISVMYGVPTMFEAIAQRLEQGETKTETLRTCIASGAKMAQHKKTVLEKTWTKAEWIEFYGASELSFVSILHHKDRFRSKNALGYPFSNVEVSVRNENGEDVEPGNIGELFVRSPMVFAGYYPRVSSDPEAFISSGDLVQQEEDGFLHLAGRKKNMIVTGGLNVYPEEVEEVLKASPMVKDAVVVGIEDEYWGEAVAALLVAKDHMQIEDDIKAYCKKQIASYKCPRFVMTADEIPLTTSGKPSRQKVKEKIEKQFRLEGQLQ
ncbi:AMP-binding protein [Alteribacillus bidgolensis]|uniref:Long-chain acyl-CoA synthetase n=1 Tax=Alteribacillus bidgolensis TaxID=930129 RepID=A0A1G8JDM7_9BACI|nr:AMP-binding protein [Alteribacillus bidgolensis]SDI29379.1 long-chain acyl-CoA synthetase [Alteribacillus bidgolensis]